MWVRRRHVIAVHITSVTGIGGGNPPTQLLVEGTASSCEAVSVVANCTKGLEKPIDISATPVNAAGQNVWSVALKVDPNCPCGTVITVSADCALGAPGGDSKTFTLCDECPTVTVDVVVGDCEQTGPLAGTRPVTYTVTFNPPLGSNTAYVNISYGGTDAATGLSSASVSGTGGSSVVKTAHLSPSPLGYASTASVTVLSPQNAALCVPPLPIFSFTTRAAGVPPRVDVDPCLPCPSSVQVVVGQPVPPLIAPHVQLEATVVWPNATPPPPPPVPATYTWTVTLPNGTQAHHTGPDATLNTLTGWTGQGATASGAVDLSVGGPYAVGVTAQYPLAAGLPTDPTTGIPSCNLTGSTTFLIPNPPQPTCPTITGVQATTADCADATQSKSATVAFSASVNNAAAAVGQYHWNFGDPGSGALNTASTLQPQAQHVYAKPGNYLITVSVGVPSNCPPASGQGTLTVGECPCPPGLVRDANHKCVTPPPVVKPPKDTTTGGGGFDWCCFGIILWGILHLTTATLLYFNLWWGALGVGIAATIALVVWNAACCNPCSLKPWSCCVLLGWLWVFNFLASSTLFGLLAAGQGGNGFVVAGFAAGTALAGLLLGLGNCPTPNPVFPPSWPPCRCP